MGQRSSVSGALSGGTAIPREGQRGSQDRLSVTNPTQRTEDLLRNPTCMSSLQPGFSGTKYTHLHCLAGVNKAGEDTSISWENL